MSEIVKLSKRIKTGLPIYVVEDHNEFVKKNLDDGIRCRHFRFESKRALIGRLLETRFHALKHVYRTIGRKGLPFSGFPLIHFDSHPDLLIPKNLDPLQIKDKQHVFDAISIENWIMPAVLAGHLSEVVWIKPPWATKTIPDCSKDFFIGLHKDTQQIRVTCPQSYFVSELLYAPLESLETPTPCKLTVFGLGNLLDAPNIANAGPSQSVSRAETTRLPSNERSKETPYSAQGALAQERVLRTPQGHSDSENGSSKERNSEKVASKAQFELSQGELIINELVQRMESDTDSPCRYALDIDLDFYSTKNPFLQEVGEKILDILKELYYFKLPVCETEQEIVKVMSEREKQLDILEDQLRQTILTTDQLTNPLLIRLREAVEDFLSDEEAKNKVDTISPTTAGPHAASSLTEEEQPSSTSKFLRTKDRDDLPGYLHEVGCTCDETPLPHHVSSDCQIAHLVEVTANFLKKLPKPAVVTLARSSLDEYCPQDQVDDIQSKIILMLENVFGSLNVTLDY